MVKTDIRHHADAEEQIAPPVQVWLVDDDNQIRGLVAETLELQGRIACTRQFDSPNGLLSALASRTGPDVILLDVQMGEFNGLDALPAIKSLARDTRVFMLTTFFNPRWHQRAMESGASGYYLKGGSMDKLVESIRDRSSPGAAAGRRRRRPSCLRPQARALTTANADHSIAAGNKPKARKQGILIGWFKRFARF